MGPRALWKRAVALLAAVGVSIFLAGGISADDENAEAVAVRALKPTQAIADIPQEYNELFTIQWGGGSLYHLKARLATMGCMLNTIWVYDDNQWYGYNQYNVPHSFNQPFLTQFKDGIPTTSLHGSCIEICSFDIEADSFLKAGECKDWEDIREYWEQSIAERDTSGGNELEGNECNNDFTLIVKRMVFPLLPLLPDTCVIRQMYINPDYTKPRYVGGGASVGYINLSLEPLSFYNESKELQEKIRIRALHIEIHELCHIQQFYYSVQQAKLNQNVYIGIEIEKTDANQELMDIVGFTELTEWNFQLPEDSAYREIYSIYPTELSAELCTLYLFEKIGMRSTKYKNYDPNRYLTPQIVQWLETYMVLPRPNVEDE